MGLPGIRQKLVSAVFSGSTTHVRRLPSSHVFTYKVYMAYVDLAELMDGSLDCWPLFSSRSPWAVLSLFSRDHMIHEDLKTDLLTRVRDFVEKNSGTRPTGPVRLLTNLRIFGVEFNPVSFYYIFNDDDTQVELIVAEVANFPWFEQHCYLVVPDVESQSDPRYQEHQRLEPFQANAKQFHVSPFMPIEPLTYHWLFSRPTDSLAVRINLYDHTSKFFFVSLDAKRKPWAKANLLRMQLLFPWHSLTVMLAILYESAKLFRRGFTFFPHPNGAQSWLSVGVERVVTTVTSIGSIFSQQRTQAPA